MRPNLNILLSFIEKKLQKTSVRSKPWKFFIEVSLSCNLRCVTCQHHYASFGGIMHNRVFEKIKPTLSSARVVHEVGYGEPLLDRNFMQKLVYLKQMGATVDVYTNGMLIDEAVSQDLVSTGLDQITFSVDGGTAETFDAIRIGASYTKLLENIKNLHRIKTLAKSDKPLLRANFVGMRRNITELPRAINALARVGVKEVVLGDMVPPVPELSQECLFYSSDIANRAIRESAEVARQRRVNFIYPPAFNEPRMPETSQAVDDLRIHSQHPPIPDPKAPPRVQTDRPTGPCRHKYPCYEPWQTLYITFDGHVRPCCVLAESFGNLLHDDIAHIWNSPKYRLLRKTVNSSEPAFDACKTCLLRKRVRFSLRHIIDMGVWALRNDGVSTTAKKAIKYLSEYF